MEETAPVEMDSDQDPDSDSVQETARVPGLSAGTDSSGDNS